MRNCVRLGKASASPPILQPVGFGVRFDWGLQGATAIAAGAAAIVVDVLSFTTTLSVAIDAGIEVFPYRFRDASAAAFAASTGRCAGGRPPGGRRRPESACRRCPCGGPPNAGGPLTVTSKLVLPSPNGAAICRQLGEAQVAGRRRVAAQRLRLRGWAVKAVRGPIAVVAAGERWPGDALRPAVEDLWGAGLVIDALAAARRGSAVAGGGVRPRRLPVAGPTRRWRSAACASGRELAEAGYGEEIAVAAEIDVSRRVPVLTGDAFRLG